MLTQETLKGILHYNPDTGLFTWLVGYREGRVATYKNDSGYLLISYKGKRYRAHRLAFLFMEGSYPELVDHINMIKDDNRWCNLRSCTKAENQRNTKAYSSNTSGIKGVSFSKSKGKWRGYVMLDGKQYHCGYWDTIEQAAEAVQLKRVELHGEFVNHG